MGPAAICNLCGRPCCTLWEAGIPCFFCGEGLFIHRYYWHFRACPDCEGIGSSLCETCNRVGCLAIAKEDELDLEALYTWLVGLDHRYRSDGQRVSAPVAEAVAYARVELEALTGVPWDAHAGAPDTSAVSVALAVRHIWSKLTTRNSESRCESDAAHRTTSQQCSTSARRLDSAGSRLCPCTIGSQWPLMATI